ncbi:MAG TPA: acyl-CoA dehydrogenase family protein [Dehalococcoidia bacterium]|nr:acyl-CoA dehydrogenase family protein [Dehalococcoidia bacterium]
MDMELTEAQQRLMETARRFLQNECPPKAVREQESTEAGFSPELWKKMAELGWLGLSFPEQYGGLGLGKVDLCILARELGRAICPSPFISSVVLAAGTIALAGSDEQKSELLPRIAGGQAVVAFAFQEESVYWDPRGIKTRAAALDGGYAINGTKMFVEYANSADYFLVPARTSGDGDSGGITIFLVDGRAPGIKLQPLATMARDRQFRVTFEDVRAAATDAVGVIGEGWPVLEKAILSGAVTLSAYMVGASERIHEMAVEFAKQRVQYDRPIGSFQSIQHYLAQSITEIIGADTMTLYAAWSLDQGLASREIVAKAKALAGDTFKSASALGAQIYGGIGFNEDVDTTLFLRRGKQAQHSLGDTGYWEDMIATELLGEA